MELFELLTLILLFNGLCCLSNMFIEEPRDVCINEGSNALFRCTLAGATATPFWKINGQIYSSTRLPAKHEFNGIELVVQNADLSMNNSTYSCLYYVEISEELILLESAQAKLSVHSLDSAACLVIRTSTVVGSFSRSPSSTWHPVSYKSPKINSTMCTLRWVSLSTAVTLRPSTTPSKKLPSSQVQAVIYLSIAGLALLCAIVIITIVFGLLCVKMLRWHKSLQLEPHPNNTEPIYEEIAELTNIHQNPDNELTSNHQNHPDNANCSSDTKIKLERNSCYANTGDHIITKQCSAYDIV